MTEEISIKVTRQSNYQFLIDFGPELANGLGDEPAPLGEGMGPSPLQLLAASVANCLSSSLIFAFHKFKEDPGELTTSVSCQIGRDQHNRLRVQRMKVVITLGVAVGPSSHVTRALQQFEQFCTVSKSIENGIRYTLTILNPDGFVLSERGDDPMHIAAPGNAAAPI